jgi:ribonuclease I
MDCDRTRLREVRICMTRELKFRDCGAERRACLPLRHAGDAAGARAVTVIVAAP